MRTEGLRSSTAALADVAANRAIRRIEVAWALGTAGDGALLVVLLVFAYDAGGTLAVGLLGALRILPAIVAAPFAPSLVGRFRGERVLTAINVVRALGATAAGIVIAFELPVEVAYVLAAVVAGAGSLVRPIQAALLPALARSPRELVAANVASSVGEGTGTFLGPALAALMLALTGSFATSLLVGAVFAAAAAAVTGVRFEQETDSRGGARSAPVRLADLAEPLRRYPGSRLVTADFVAQVFVRGLLVTLIVVAALELLDLGDGGVGLLNAAIGLGGLLGALGALGLAADTRLARVFVVALACWGLPLVVLGLVPVTAVAIVGLLVLGASNAVLDVVGFTIVQREVRNEDRVTMFGAMEGLFGVGLFLGSLAGPALVALAGARGGLAVAGALLVLAALLTVRPISRRTRESPLTPELAELFASNPLFAPLPLTALEHLAERARPVSFETGEEIMRKGEPGDCYVLLSHGTVRVVDDGHVLRTCGPGEGFGEIALLRRVPRTATVVAETPASGLEIDAETFLAALEGPSASAAAEAIVAQRLERSRLVG